MSNIRNFAKIKKFQINELIELGADKRAKGALKIKKIILRCTQQPTQIYWYVKQTINK